MPRTAPWDSPVLQVNVLRGRQKSMRVLLATSDPVRLSFLVALLRDAGLAPVVLDGHISALEGGIGACPRRLAVPAEEERQAVRVLAEAGELHR